MPPRPVLPFQAVKAGVRNLPACIFQPRRRGQKFLQWWVFLPAWAPDRTVPILSAAISAAAARPALIPRATACHAPTQVKHARVRRVRQPLLARFFWHVWAWGVRESSRKPRTDKIARPGEARCFAILARMAKAAAAKKLFLVDAMGFIFRAYFAPMGRLNSPAGIPTKVPYLFANMLRKLAKEHAPDYLAVVFDTKEPTF